MPFLEKIHKVADIQMNATDPLLEAWLYHFSVDNNIDYLLNPSIVASPEQLNFMVALKEQQIYIPSSDKIFLDLLYKNNHAIEKEYKECWRVVTNMILSYSLTVKDQRRLVSFCRYRFQKAVHGKTMLPSRLSKRLVGIVVSQCGQRDPYFERKCKANALAKKLYDNKSLQEKIYSLPASLKKSDIRAMRKSLNTLEIQRLMSLATIPNLYKAEATLTEAKQAIADAGTDTSVLAPAFENGSDESKKFLILSARSGWFVFDVAIAKALIQQGHQVMLSVKDDFYFNAPILYDLENDPTLRSQLQDAFILRDTAITKNELLRHLREHRLVIISDGTSEQLNLCRTSVTFARAWKESDVILAAGKRQKNVLLDTSHEFTRDIVCYWREGEQFHIQHKIRALWVKQFAEKDLLTKADELIEKMQKAKQQGKKVMFYSAVIGSIPGQTEMAIKIVNAFVKELRKRLDTTFIINPAEHFIEGMDGDDLMFTWERVQRSGFLDVWRFQTSEDIEKSFSILNTKMPAVWLGKDSTFSTGCTKEMAIALDVQVENPELQIIGPRAELFFRRRDYGVGKYYDAILK